MPTPRALDAVYRDRRSTPRSSGIVGAPGRASATVLTVLWAAYLGAIAPVVWMGLATVKAMAEGPTPAEPDVFGAMSVIASGIVLMVHIVATGLGVCVALASIVVAHASRCAVRKLPFAIALGGAMLSVALLEPPTSIAAAFVQLLAMVGTAAYGVYGTWRVWRASQPRSMATTR